MGAPHPWPTRWAEPEVIPFDPETGEPLETGGYEIEENPAEDPYRLPEEFLTPYAVTWGVTHPCNLRCDHCYDVVGYKRTDLDTAQAMTVIDRLAAAGITFIVFSGGEPLLRRDLFDLMAYCLPRRIQFGIRSNATLITREKAQRFADMGMAVAGVSIDGANSAAHDAVRGAGTFELTEAGITALRDAGIRVNVEVVLRRSNLHQALDFIALAERWNVQEINFSTVTAQGRGQNLPDERLDYAAWRDITTRLHRASLDAAIAVSPACALTGACPACIEPNITCDGWVTPCYLSKKKLFHMLDIAPEEFRVRLKQYRRETINICGREQWIKKVPSSEY